MARKPKTKTEEKLEAAEIGQESIAQQDATSESAVTSEYRSRCGGALRTNREKQGLSVQTVASRLRLSVKQIEALESDNFDALPEPTIVRGFIRNYAKQLGISFEPLLDAYNVLVPDKAPQSFTVPPAPYAGSRQYKKPNLKGLLPMLLVVLLGAGVWLFYQSYIEKPNPVAPTASKLPAPEPLPQAALPAGERQPEASDAQSATTEITLPPGNTATPATVTEVAPTPAPQVNADTQMTQSPSAAPSEGTAAVAPVNATKVSKLEFSATQETWISVTDANGKEIFNKILFAGNHEVFEAPPPLNVVIGNASGTSLSVNGVETNLGPHTKVNVARLKVE